MKIRFASALFALSLPLLAQAPAADTVENLFYKAYWLEKGERDYANAMSLYEQFLTKSPEHRLAKDAAAQQLGLLNKTGKAKEAEAFAAKYEKLLGKGAAAAKPAAGDAPAGGGRPGGAPGAGAGGRGERGEGGERGGRGERGQGGDAAGQRFNPQERIAQLEKEIAEAKAAGDTEKVKTLEERLDRTKRMAERGANAGAGGRGEGGGPPGAGGPGQGGPGGGRRGGGLFGTKKLAEMNAEELGQFKDRLQMVDGMLERMRENMSEEQVKTVETNLDALKKGLEANKLDDAQKALDKIREAMPMGRRRGGGGN